MGLALNREVFKALIFMLNFVLMELRYLAVYNYSICDSSLMKLLRTTEDIT